VASHCNAKASPRWEGSGLLVHEGERKVLPRRRSSTACWMVA
jgi:hypothetical protein